MGTRNKTHNHRHLPKQRHKHKGKHHQPNTSLGHEIPEVIEGLLTEASAMPSIAHVDSATQDHEIAVALDTYLNELDADFALSGDRDSVKVAAPSSRTGYSASASPSDLPIEDLLTFSPLPVREYLGTPEGSPVVDMTSSMLSVRSDPIDIPRPADEQTTLPDAEDDFIPIGRPEPRPVPARTPTPFEGNDLEFKPISATDLPKPPSPSDDDTVIIDTDVTVNDGYIEVPKKPATPIKPTTPVQTAPAKSGGWSMFGLFNLFSRQAPTGQTAVTAPASQASATPAQLPKVSALTLLLKGAAAPATAATLPDATGRQSPRPQ